MNATIGKMSKRINSTKRTFSGTQHSVVLKDPVSVKNPKILITGTPAIGSNYMSWNGAYYYIDDIVSNTNGTSWVIGHIDELATFKGTILNSTALVKFGPSSQKNTMMDDIRFGPDLQWLDARKSIVIPDLDVFDRGGCVVLTCTAATDFTTNGVVQYILSYTEVMNYLAAFGSTIKTDMNGSADVKEAIINMVIGATGGGNFTDNIKSMVWLPFSPNTVGPEVGGVLSTEMGIGGYRVTGSGFYIAHSPIGIKKYEGYVSIPWETDATTYSFLRLPKYTSMTLCHPCGAVNIDTTALIDQNSVYVTVVMNVLTGDYYVKVKETDSDSAEPLAFAQGNVALDVSGMIAGGGTVAGNTIGSMVNTSISAATMGAFGDGIYRKSPGTSKAIHTNTTSTGNMDYETESTIQTNDSGILKNFMHTATPPTSCQASLSGGPLNLYQTSTFNSQFYIQMNAKKPRILSTASDYSDYCDTYGWPVNTYMSLSGLTGYVECADVSVNPTGNLLPNASELSSLNSQLCSGIYIE